MNVPDCPDNCVDENVFNENYDNGDLSESEDSSTEDQMMIGDDEFGTTLGISVELAIANYEAAGSEVDEEPERITVAGNKDMMNDEVDGALNQIISELDLPYKLAEFQRVAINGLAQKKNLVLVSPTGSGKMNIPLLASLVLRKT